jgi:imidazolonepropionase-like amidohydrolase
MKRAAQHGHPCDAFHVVNANNGTQIAQEKRIMSSTLMIAGWLLDGTGSPTRENIFLKISGATLTAVEPTHLLPDRKREGVQVLDFSQCTVLPALMDCHVHLFMAGSNEANVREFQLNAGFDDVLEVISGNLQQHARHGVAAVRDGGDRQGHVIRYKHEKMTDRDGPVRVKVAGKAWKRPGRYGKLIGRSLPETQSLKSAIENGLRDSGTAMPDHIKIVNSGLNSLTEFGKQTPPQFDLETLKGAVAAASRFDLPVMVHANGKLPVGIAIDAGVRSIEHGFFMGRENLEKMADRQIFWVPTAVTMSMYAANLKPGSVEVDIARRNLDQQLEQLYLAKRLGVPVAVGTDAGSLGVHHGSAVVEEMSLFVEAGFSLAEAVCCAAKHGSELLGLPELGVLCPGKEASFIVVKGHPEKLLDGLRNPEMIFIKGEPVGESRSLTG